MNLGPLALAMPIVSKRSVEHVLDALALLLLMLLLQRLDRILPRGSIAGSLGRGLYADAPAAEHGMIEEQASRAALCVGHCTHQQRVLELIYAQETFRRRATLLCAAS